MLNVPAFRTIDGVTLYTDDLCWYRFYAIAQGPRVRVDENNDPVFLLVKYAFSDEDREQNAKLPSGGGYMNFDVEFSVEPEQLEKIQIELQEWVDAEWSRLRNGTAEEKSLPGVQGTTEPPKVDFGTPTFTQGTVRMDAPQVESLVEARVAEGNPSLLSDNLAVFSMDLSAPGATFMQKTLVGEDGNNPTDLTPVQIRYDLAFWARLPAVRINVTADSERIYDQVRKYMDGEGVDQCTSYQFQNSDITTNTATMAGLIEVKIDPGSASLDDEVIADLRQYALDMMQQMVESRFFTDDPGEGYHPEFPDGPPPEVVDDQRKKADDGRRRNENPKKYLRQNYDKSSMHLELNLEQRSVVEWTIHPQATLTTFFEGRTAEDLKRFVRVVDLTDPFFEHLDLVVRAFADFNDADLEAVEVEVRYSGRDANGEQQEKNQSFTFTTNDPQKWSPALIGDKREYEFRYRIKFRGHEFTQPTGWQRSTASQLNLSLPATGKVSLAVAAGDIDFETLIKRVQVTLSYADTEAGIPNEEFTVVLDAANLAQNYQRAVFNLVRNPIRYRRRFLLQSGEVLEDPEWSETSSRQLLVNQPFNDFLNVRLLPVGDAWDQVVQVIVDLRYRDPAQAFEVNESMAIKSNAEFRTWRVVLPDKTRREFEYRIARSFKDGRFEQSDWAPQNGTETLPIPVNGPPVQRIRFVADRLDLETSPVTELALKHLVTGAEETLIFRSKDPQEWLVPAPAGTPIHYEARPTYFPANADPVQAPRIEESDSVLVLSPYRPPKGGAITVRVLPTLIDFAKAPLVVVDLTYEDEANGVNQIESLALTSKEELSWTFPVKDVNRKLYSYKITYFLAPDNNATTTEVKFQDRPLLVVPNVAA